MGRRYFGTDGIRGRVGVTPMTAEFAVKLGWAAGRVLGGSDGARVVIGKDTRRSGYLLESALEAGLSSAGVEVLLLGPIPTPAVAYLTRALRADAGIVISASHNPHHDNGVKFFGPQGGKLSDAIETEIEALMEQPMETVAPETIGLARRIDDAQGRYIEYCKASFGDGRLDGLRLVLDCANGAAYRTAPAIFDELGADIVEVIGGEPNGFNINLDCGSTHLQALQASVRAHGADLGIALDGDADRCLLVDADGEVVDGDQILYALAVDRHQRDLLRGPVVGTLMSNLGLEQALQVRGIGFERAAVGIATSWNACWPAAVCWAGDLGTHAVPRQIIDRRRLCDRTADAVGHDRGGVYTPRARRGHDPMPAGVDQHPRGRIGQAAA